MKLKQLLTAFRGFVGAIITIAVIALFAYFVYQLFSINNSVWKNTNPITEMSWQPFDTVFFSGELTASSKNEFVITTTEGNPVIIGKKGESGMYSGTFVATAGSFYRTSSTIKVKSTQKSRIFFIMDPFNISDITRK
jgi:hypothetical protein